ncbi:MucB/RseB C-terminal domain-containing protein [Gallaecimonas kandeliae]|uniref:MucB/RseB C-terminal domain-containing protein n=1 Tax=Gallaecimonas kandeliae TaxID=3029055 RepID=UPI00264A0A4E|nr:MucB/RseB C-terminal domain-containing protein [Gallaecimonas kandeliae]WKE66419.1 MucB/RseB C-terminal domain-containing protein [Gallaecimonas kandeliae]
MMSTWLVLAALTATPASPAASPQDPGAQPPAQEASADSQQAMDWLSDLSKALTQGNYVLSLVKVQEGRVQPFRYEHGVIDGQEVEHLVFLNGPPREVVRKGGVVTLLDMEHSPFSYKADSIRGPIPDALLSPPADLAQHYDLVLAGISRIAGHPAQLLRIVPKDNYRHGYWIWIDKDSHLPLRVDRVAQDAAVVEQLMVVDLDELKAPSDHLQRVAAVQFPAPSLNPQARPLTLGKVTWLPPGFHPVVANYHRLAQLGEGVDYWLYSDGLAEIAVYINPSAPSQELTMRQSGFYNLVGINHGGVEVMAVGTVPTEALERVASQVTLVRP